MEAISNLIKSNRVFTGNIARLQEQIAEKENTLRSFKSHISMSYDEFRQLLSSNAY